MELNYKLITKEQLPTEARVSFAIRNTEFYCWLLKDQLLINAEAPHLDLVLDALRIHWMYEFVDWEEDMKIDAACKIIKQLWTPTGYRQAFDAWHEQVNMEQTTRRQAWAMEVLSQYGGQKGLDILDTMEDDDSYLYDTLYSVATKQSGSKQGWKQFHVVVQFDRRSLAAAAGAGIFGHIIFLLSSIGGGSGRRRFWWRAVLLADKLLLPVPFAVAGHRGDGNAEGVRYFAVGFSLQPEKPPQLRVPFGLLHVA